MNMISGILLILELFTEVAVITAEFSKLVQNARAKGRDISDDELMQLKMKRQSAVEKLNTLGPQSSEEPE